MTHATRPDSLVTKGVVSTFRKLMVVVFGAGAIAGLVLFVVQYFTVVPLIQSAEAYESAAHQAHPQATNEDEGWHPAEGWQRSSLTALTTVLTGIGFAAILFGVMALSGKTIDTQHGALWGLAAFTCFSLAPAFGLPPQPPGVVVADLHQRQLWWTGTVIATAVGMWLINGQKRSWPLRTSGVVCLLLPHLIGAPTASGLSSVPVELVRRFTIASLATSGVFWLLVGTLGGLIYSRGQTDS
jgi:cobalt transporter subunit CbtA